MDDRVVLLLFVWFENDSAKESACLAKFAAAGDNISSESFSRNENIPHQQGCGSGQNLPVKCEIGVKFPGSWFWQV